MRFDSLSPAARAIWAKSADPSGHGLLAHMLDVSAVAEQLLALESPQTLAWAADVFGLPSHAAARWLATMVGLHDLGKAIPGFQAKWPQGREADTPDRDAATWYQCPGAYFVTDRKTTCQTLPSPMLSPNSLLSA